MLHPEQYGNQRFPHKYLRRFRKDGKWAYVYTDDTPKTFAQAVANTKEYKLVIAQGKPTSFMVDPEDSTIAYGPPQTLGKVLMVNTNPGKSYFGRAVSRDGIGAPVYLYDEEHLKDAAAKKSAKFLKGERAKELLNQTAEQMLYSWNDEDRQMGMVIWLNNETGLRIGAHETAASVDPKERAAIISQSKKEEWTEREKYEALSQARRPTFGLLSTRVGHLAIDPLNRIVSWNFRGKGGKMITGENVSIKLDPHKFMVMQQLTEGKKPDD